jgi:hypothetical protein
MSERETINFSEMTPEQQQTWVDISLHEEARHYDDIRRLQKERDFIEKNFGIKARNVLVNCWVEILNEKKEA